MSEENSSGIKKYLWPAIIGVLSLALLVIAGTLATYYLYIIPKQNADKFAFEQQKYTQELQEKEDKKQSDEAERSAKELEKVLKQADLTACLENASALYMSDWTDYCGIWKKEVKTIYDKCKQNLGGGADAKKWCMANTPDYNLDGNQMCLLPKKYSESVENKLKESKDECYKKFK